MFSIRNLQEFFEGRTVLLTGHTGFKGSWLSLLLNSLGANVVGYALSPPTDPNHFQAAQLGEVVDDIRGDIREADRVVDAVKTSRPSIVIHLAAQALVLEGYERPRETFDTNVQGTVNVMEAVEIVDSVDAAVVVTSDKCYAEVDGEYSHRESDPLGGNDPYSASKACAEHVANAYRSAVLSNSPVATARAGNVIGGGDWGADRLLPDCARAISAGEAIELRNPDAVRPWQYVLEPLLGYLRLAELLSRGEPVEKAWNFGPGEPRVLTVRDVVQSIISRWGEGTYEVTEGASPSEDDFLQLDSTRSRVELDWRTVYDVETALDKSVEWYRTYYESVDVDMRELSARHVDDFLDAFAAIQ